MSKQTSNSDRVRFSFQVRGMTCAHCERKVEEVAGSMEGVESAMADTRKKQLALICRGGTDKAALFSAIDAALQGEGYSLVAEEAIKAGRRDMLFASAAGLLLAAFFFIADHLGLFAIIPVIETGLGIGTLFVIGLLTSLHCISMCGGIALSQGVRRVPSGQNNANPDNREGLLAKLAPSLSYNFGRITSYTLIGAAVGAAGSALNIGLFGKAILMGLAGIFMLLMGLSMIGLIRLPTIHWPAFDRLRGRVNSKALRFGPFAVGLANGFMPCGPLQAMQIYALGSGSALTGALAMFAFSSGTAPLLFAFGAGGALVPLRQRAMAVRAGSVLVAFLGLTTLGRAWALSGLNTPVQTLQPAVSQAQGSAPAQVAVAAAPAGKQAVIVDGVQTVTVDVGPRSYGDIVVQVGIPVRLNLYVAPGRLNGCNNAIIIPAFQLQQRLSVGDNFVEFTPQAVGVIPYSCWMAMIHARITVVERQSQTADPTSWLASFQAGSNNSAGNQDGYVDDCCAPGAFDASIIASSLAGDNCAEDCEEHDDDPEHSGDACCP